MAPLPAVLVTGGAKRIGAAIVRRFAEAGWHVVIHANSSIADARTLAASLPSAEAIAADLADESAARAMMATLAGRLPDWRALINSASLFEKDDVTELDTATNRRAMTVNAVTPALLVQAFLSSARADGGRTVIHLTDQKLANPNPDFFSYTMSKHALSGTIAMFSKALSDPRDRIYGLAPGAILPSYDQSPEEAETSHRLNLLRRRTTSEEVADAALFLCQRWLASGQTLLVDSGQHLLDQPRDVIYLARESNHEVTH